MVVVLLCITAVTSAAVGMVFRVTEEPIALAKTQKKRAALSEVLPQFDNSPTEEVQTIPIDNGEVYIYTARNGGEVVGYAVESFSYGYGGAIKMMVGFDPDGMIRNIRVLEQAETPGLGAKITEEGNPVLTSLVNRNPGDIMMAVRKDGGDIDAITASTVSSRAYVSGVSRAYAAFLQASGNEAAGEWDTSSGATSASGAGNTSESERDSGEAVSSGAASADTPSTATGDTSTGATTTGND